MGERDVQRLDAALVRLRRLWSSPSQAIEADGVRIEMSSLLLLEAWAQLADHDQPDARVGIAALRAFAAVRPSTLTRLLDRAVAAGLMIRLPSDADKRRGFVTATTAGRALREQAVLLRTSWLRAQLAQWPEDEVRTLAALLERFAIQVQANGGPESHRSDNSTAPLTPVPAAAGGRGSDLLEGQA